MSNSNEKYLGESPLKGGTNKKLTLKLKEESVNKTHLSQDLQHEVDRIEDLQNQIDSIQIGGWAISQEFGNDEHIGISQKALTEFRDEEIQKDAEQDETLGEHTAELANHETELENRYTKSETYNKEEINEMYTTPDQHYESYSAEDGDSLSDILPATGEAHTIYRVGNWDGEEYTEGCYSEYAWAGAETGYVPLSVKHPGIDEEPVTDSDNLVESGGLYEILKGVEIMKPFDISEGYRYKASDSEEVEFSSSDIWKYIVEAGKTYSFSAKNTGDYALTLINWTDSDGTSVSSEGYKRTAGDENPTVFTDVYLTAPSGATRCYVNVQKVQSSNYNFKGYSIIKSNDLLSSINQNASDISTNQDYALSSFSEQEKMYPEAITENYRVTGSGEVEDDRYSIWKFSVNEGTLYTFNGYRAKNQTASFLFWYDVNDKCILTSPYRGSTESAVTYKRQAVRTPEGAVYVKMNVQNVYSSRHAFYECKDEIKNTELNDKADTTLAYISELVVKEPSDISYNHRMGPDGEIAYNSMDIWKYEVEEGQQYTFSASTTGNNSGVYVIYWEQVDGEDVSYISREYKTPNVDSIVENVLVVAPAGANYLYMNVKKTLASAYNVKTIGEPISSDSLKEQINALTHLQDKNMELTISGDPADIGTNFIIRTKYNAEKDIVVVYKRKDNDEIAPCYTYLGDNDLATDDIVTSSNKFQHWEDSTGPLRNGSKAPWHMFAQHGYEIPTFTCSHSLTDEYLGTLWTDDQGREFYIGRISGNILYLLPKVTGPDANGLYTRAWENHTKSDAAIATLTNGGITLSRTSQSYIQLRPIQSSTTLKILVDGAEVHEAGVYMCNDVIMSETLICYNPFATANDYTKWFPEVTGDEDHIAMELVQSFNIHGLSHRYDTIINMKEPLVFDKYGANQAQCLYRGQDDSQIGSITEGYDAYIMVPKVKSSVNSKRVDMPNVFGADIPCARNTDVLYDTDDMPDRVISYLYDSTEQEFLAGFAAGLSIVRGLSTKVNRNSQIDNNYVALSVNYGLRNKAYFNILSYNKFVNGALPAGFIGCFSTYWAYFDPSANKGQVYWYKDGNSFIIYAHYQDANSHIAMNLPAELDGLTFDVVEKTDGVTIETDYIANGKIYLSTSSSDHNYVVLKTQ